MSIAAHVADVRAENGQLATREICCGAGGRVVLRRTLPDALVDELAKGVEDLCADGPLRWVELDHCNVAQHLGALRARSQPHGGRQCKCAAERRKPFVGVFTWMAILRVFTLSSFSHALRSSSFNLVPAEGTAMIAISKWGKKKHKGERKKKATSGGRVSGGGW